MIEEITLRNIFSFGPDTEPLRLGRLNVLIGPNGSGKSNLIEAINILRNTPKDVAETISKGGGINDLIWKGKPDGIATIEAFFKSIRHRLEFTSMNGRFGVIDETIASDTVSYKLSSPSDSLAYLENMIEIDKSILNQQNLHVEDFADLFQDIETIYSKILIYPNWQFGPRSDIRKPQSSSVNRYPLKEDFSNLALFLNEIKRKPLVKRDILEGLHNLYEGITDFDIQIISGNWVELRLTEGDYDFPAARLSDGTLRYLCLLAILYDPNPPTLVCIEEPELGLHPDILPGLADQLIKASERMQLIVTTHSNIIVDALSDYPESVVVCEKHEDKTVMQRLKQDEVKTYLEDYRLGRAWLKGMIGGVRW